MSDIAISAKFIGKVSLSTGAGATATNSASAGGTTASDTSRYGH